MSTTRKQRPGFVLSMARLFFLASVLIACSKDDKPGPPPPGNGNGNNVLKLLSFAPPHAQRGATIVLTGENFSPFNENNHITFQGTTTDAQVQTSSTTAISVVVPATAVTGKIKIKVGDQVAESVDEFVVDATPVTAIADFTPKQGPVGTVVTLTGANFGTNIHVSLNNIDAQVTQKSATQIVFTIPDNNTLASHKIKVISDGTILETTDNFTVVHPAAPAQWIGVNVNSAPAPIFQFGLSFVYKNKIYWGFSQLSSNQPQTDYLVLDPAAANPQWIMGNPPPADMAPVSLQSAVAVVHNDRVFIGTGIATLDNKSWWEYHPESNTCTRMADYPEATAHAVGFAYFNKIYVGFGGGSKKLHQYDPVTNTWTFVTNSDLYDMNGASAFVVGNEAFIGRGLAAPNTDRREFRRFGGSWLLPATSLPESIQSPETPSFSIGSKGYFVTGQKVWEYTPNNMGGSWRLVINASASGPIIKHTAVVSVNGQTKVYGWTNRGELFEFKLA